MTSTIGIPIKLLNEAQVSPHFQESQLLSVIDKADVDQNHVVTLEITSGQVYRGKLIEGISPSLYSSVPDSYPRALKKLRNAQTLMNSLSIHSRRQHERAAQRYYRHRP